MTLTSDHEVFGDSRLNTSRHLLNIVERMYFVPAIFNYILRISVSYPITFVKSWAPKGGIIKWHFGKNVSPEFKGCTENYN